MGKPTTYNSKEHQSTSKCGFCDKRGHKVAYCIEKREYRRKRASKLSRRLNNIGSEGSLYSTSEGEEEVGGEEEDRGEGGEIGGIEEEKLSNLLSNLGVKSKGAIQKGRLEEIENAHNSRRLEEIEGTRNSRMTSWDQDEWEGQIEQSSSNPRIKVGFESNLTL